MLSVNIKVCCCWPRDYFPFVLACTSKFMFLAVSRQLWPFPKYCATFLLSLTVGCLARSGELRTHTKTHRVPMLLLKMGFHGEAGWESIRGHCLRTHVYVCFFCVCVHNRSLRWCVCESCLMWQQCFSSEWRPCLSHRSDIRAILNLETLSCT